MELGRLGVWSSTLRQADTPEASAAAAVVEQLGYGSIWFPAGGGTRGFEVAHTLLEVTKRIIVATGITSIWATTPAESAAGFAELEKTAPGRFLLGLGVSHAVAVDRAVPNRYHKPLEKMASYLDELDGVPAQRRIVAALGPKMLELAEQTSLGTHPYLVSPQMTAWARARVGPTSVIAPEQGVVLETDPELARGMAREHLKVYLRLPNYVNNWRRFGYTELDVSDGGSDRLVDDIIAWGNLTEIGDRIRAHYEAGANHVCVQVVGAGAPLPLAEWEAVAREVLGT